MRTRQRRAAIDAHTTVVEQRCFSIQATVEQQAERLAAGSCRAVLDPQLQNRFVVESKQL
jgi:hypothetical protein